MNVLCSEGSLDNGNSFTITLTGNAPTTDGTCLTNSATVTANETDPNPANNTSSFQTCTVPGVGIVKSSSPTSYSAPGTLITYSYLVTNTSTNEALTNVTVTDPMPNLSAIDCGGGSNVINVLDAGASQTCTATYTTTPADVDAGNVSNTGTATGTPPSGPNVTAKDSLTVPATQSPSIGIVKTTNGSNGQDIPVGSPITWTYAVTNSGNVTLANVTVTDNKLASSSIDCGGGSNVIASLAVGASQNCTATGTATAGAYSNVGTATGTPPAGTDVTDTSTGSYFGSSPSIGIVKTTNGSNGQDIPVGSPITWTYAVTNSGNVTLANVTVTDNKLASSSIDCGGGSNVIASLAVGASQNCTATGTATAGAYSNVGTATGTPPAGTDVTDTSTGSYFGSSPSIGIVKTTNGSNGQDIPVGSPITWTYAVTNSGNVTLANVTVTDNKLASSSIDCGGGSNVIASLAVGASQNCTATGTATAGAYSNVGTATGTPPAGTDVTDTSTGSYFGSSPSIGIVKTTNGSNGQDILRGAPVTWSYDVSNSGNVTLSNVKVTDNRLPSTAINCGGGTNVIASLAPGASQTCTATGTAIQGSYSNKGTVTSHFAPTEQTVSASSKSGYFGFWPLIKLVKSTNGSNGLSIPVGSPVTWTYVVTNTGSKYAPLTNVTVTDNKVPSAEIDCGGGTNVIASLAPGASRTCTATGVATKGPYQNVGTATGTPPSGPNVLSSSKSSYHGVN